MNFIISFCLAYIHAKYSLCANALRRLLPIDQTLGHQAVEIGLCLPAALEALAGSLEAPAGSLAAIVYQENQRGSQHDNNKTL
jgi:hypothetical protein